jgi:hypothetical protein
MIALYIATVVIALVWLAIGLDTITRGSAR